MFGTRFGAYVDRDDPPIVHVFDTRDKFGAMRVGGVWRRPKSSPTVCRQSISDLGLAI